MSGDPLRPDRDSATHRLVVRGDPVERVEALNSIAAAALGSGDRAWLSVDGALFDRRPDAMDRLDAELDRQVPGTDRVGADLTYLATLPADAEVVLDILAVPAEERARVGPAGETAWRIWEVGDLLVAADGRWIYHAIPHEGRHWANATAAPGLPERARDALAGLPSALAPAGALVTWGPDGEYEIRADRVRLDGRTVDPERLRRVLVDDRRREVVFDLDERGIGPSNPLARALLRGVRRGVRALRGGSGSGGDPVGPPLRVRVPDAETLDAVESALLELRDGVGYGFDVERTGPG